jgi:Bacterial toxin 30
VTLNSISPTFSNYSTDESGGGAYNSSGGEDQGRDESGSYVMRPVARAFALALNSADQSPPSALGADESGISTIAPSTWWEQAQAVRWQGPATTELPAVDQLPAQAPSWGESDPQQSLSNGNQQSSQGSTDESGQSGNGALIAQSWPVGGASITAVALGPPTATAEELAGLDEYLNSYMNKVLIREFGQGPVAPATSSAALAQLRKYGQERYDKLGQLEQALAHIQGDYSKAREAAVNDQSKQAPGWLDVQVKVAVGGDKDESGGWITQPVYHNETVRQFDATAFSQWYNAQGFDGQGNVNLKAISNLAFGQLYGNEYSHTVEGIAEEFGTRVDTIESRFDVQLGGQPQTLVLKDGRMSQIDWLRLDLNDAPELNNDDQVGWNPMVGFNTHSTNIHEDTDWFEVVVKVVIVAIVAYVSAGTLGAAAASAMGGGLAGAVAAGAVVGATTAVASGAMNGNLSWEGVFKGALLGGLGGGVSFGVGELAQSVASEQFTTEALLDKDSLVMKLPDGGVTGGGNVQTTFDPGRGPLIEMSDPGLQQAAFERAQQTFNNVQNVGRVFQGGLVAVAGGGDFEDGAFAAIGTNLGQSVGGVVGQAVNEAAQGSISAPVAQFIGAVAGAGISSAIVNERGGDGERAFLDSVVNSAVTVVANVPVSSTTQSLELNQNDSKDWSQVPDQTDAETARLTRAENVELPAARSLDLLLSNASNNADFSIDWEFDQEPVNGGEFDKELDRNEPTLEGVLFAAAPAQTITDAGPGSPTAGSARRTMVAGMNAVLTGVQTGPLNDEASRQRAEQERQSGMALIRSSIVDGRENQRISDALGKVAGDYYAAGGINQLLSYQQSTSLLQNWLFGAGDGTYDIAGMASAFNQIGGVGSMRAGREAASALVLRGLIESGLPVDVIMQRLDFASSATFGQAYSADELARQGVDPNRKLWDSPALSGSADVVAIWAAVGPSRFGSTVKINEVNNVGANSARSVGGTIQVTSQGVALSSETLSLRGTSNLVGDFRGIRGASVDEIVARVPSNWQALPQKDGMGFRFIDDLGAERLRIHAPDIGAPAGSNSASGWTVRVQGPTKNQFYDDLGGIVGRRSNDGHIPIKGNQKVGG